MYIAADELGTFVHKYDNEMIDGLSAFYDPDPYQQVRRTSDVNIKIKSPQLNILCGTTPQNLTDFMPEKAWGQGFTSRLLMVFSDERIIGDDFAPVESSHSVDLLHDMKSSTALLVSSKSPINTAKRSTIGANSAKCQSPTIPSSSTTSPAGERISTRCP